MPIDDHPFDALERQFEMEDLTLSPVTKRILKFASLMPLPWPFDKLVESLTGHLAAGSVERMYLMLKTCMDEVRKHDTRGLRDAEPPEAAQAREEISKELLLDAARKAESTRAKARVKRIGLILANAIVEPKPTDADEVEEMMRVAMELSDRDIVFLGELTRIEGSLLQTQDHIPRYEAHTRWELGFWGNLVFPEADSVFSKLESYGLVARIPPPNNLNIMADFQNRYVLLPKGARFVTLIREVGGL
jgi:hypothetical protein